MPIDYNILIAYGGVARKIHKGEYLFQEGAMPFYYYQLVEGQVKLYSSNESGKELVQGIFTEGQSFGEPPLLLGRCYPSTAEVIKSGVIVKIRKEGFLNILRDFPEINAQFILTFAERIYNKATSVQIWVGQTPEEKISQFFQRLKSNKLYNKKEPVSYTRRQIAEQVNIRTETVIRTLKRMNKEGKITIKDHKIFLP